MLYRSVLMPLFFLISLRLVAAPDDANWDCQRADDASEWVCVAKEQKPKPESQQPRAAPESAQQLERPLDQSPSKQVESTPEPVKPALKPVEPAPKPDVSAISRRPGWTCKPDAEETGWDCTLVGPDPKGQARTVVAAEDKDPSTPAHFLDDREIYANMLRHVPSDPWTYCTSYLGPSALMGDKDARELAPMEILSDHADVFDQSIMNYSGNVAVTRADQQVWADQASFDNESQVLNARGNVYYREQGLSLYSDSAFIQLASDKARLANSRYILETVPARGSASETRRESQWITRFRDVSYSTCRPEVQDWELHARDLKLDRQRGRGEALNAWLEVAGVPVLYTPYISFPIDDRRKSGFLAANFGTTDETGFDSTVPYYWNVAPNFDMTFFPRVMSKRGIMLGSEARYLSQAGNSEVSFEIVPYDTLRDEVRGQASLINDTRISQNLHLDMDLNYVSDDDYLDELGDTLSLSDSRHVLSRANLHYTRPNVSLLTRLEHYETIDSSIASIDRPYSRLPQVLLNIGKQIGATGASAGLATEFVNFERSSRVHGQRWDVKPRLVYNYQTPAMFLTPSVSLQHTQYWLEDPGTSSSSNIDRTLPIVSVDSGIFLERDVGIGGRTFLQTLEPRVYYLYIPEDNQENLPLFDTSINDFSFSQMFRENRFSGTDRINDANQLTLGLTSRLIDDANGRERLRASIGQIYFFKDREVTLDNTAPETDSSSNLVADFNVLIADGLTFRSGLQWNPHRNDIERGQATLQYRDGFERIFNLSYRYRQDPITDSRTIDQADTSFRWPIASDIHLIGRWQYSLLDRVTLESFIGFEKESCCWRFRLLGRRFVNDVNSVADDNSRETNAGIFVQLELKGFTSFGDKVERFLERNISGYRLPEK